MTPDQLRQKYLDFFQARDHAIVPSAPLVPENDPTTLFTGSGMQPMVPYLLGQEHPLGKRIADSQKCFRAEDIEEVGDNRHTTFFEMLGNWSLGDYFKTQQLSWFFEFLTEELNLDPSRLYVTVFAGNQQLKIGKDQQSVQLWQQLFAKHNIKAKVVDQAEQQGLQNGRIFYYDETKNWWSRAGVPADMPVGEPGGPDSELFYDFGLAQGFHQRSEFKDQPCHVNCDCGRFLEIGNSVFMQYQKTKTGFQELPQKNVDFGGGFERILAAVQDDPDIFKTQLFQPVITKLEQLTNQSYADASELAKHPFRVIADHVRAAVMLIADGVKPGNKEQSYFVRRLLRRAVRYGKQLELEKPFLGDLVTTVAEIYAKPYPEVQEQQEQIQQVVTKEEQNFHRTLNKGLKKFQQAIDDLQQLDAQTAFELYQTYGFPLELSLEEAKQAQIKIESKIKDKFAQLKKQHAQQSRTASAGKFKGGLEDQSVVTTQYHTATHLLHAALRKILGDQVEQRGSNITAKRLRFDFSHTKPLTATQIQQVEDQVNDWIDQDLPINKQTMSKAAALKAGALAFFVERYPAEVDVYTIGDPDKEWVSKELCGGPHVSSTGEIDQLKIFKEKSAAAGVRRIYAKT
ncbi:MAG: alanine--tRNA ligase [Candidatus Pacebacteria bacterium]|nr:alanine--tRNA ligase [Candidatus Paceibacterota bacterium]